MKPTTRLPFGIITLLILACSSKTEAHTWIEQLMRIASNGTFVGTPGYPRGYVPRIGSVNVDDNMVWRLPATGSGTNAFLPSDSMCKPSQTIGNQTAGFPALIASAGDQITLRYEENGHVTQPQIPVGRPEGSGTVYVYGTEKPEDTDTYLGIHRVWNIAGTGGDKRGVLLATRHFDDGQCYQINNSSSISLARQAEFPHKANSLMGADLWCQTNIQIPADATGNYTLYWVWEWPILTPTGEVASNESYTTCMDIVLTPSTGQSKAEAVNFAVGQDLNSAAIAPQMSKAFLVNPTASQQTFVAGSAPTTFTGSIAAPSNAPAPAPNSLSVTIPTTSPGVQLSTQASASSSQHNSAAGAGAGGFVTVTVTAAPAEETVTVTKTVNGGASQPTAAAKSTPEASAGTQTASSAPAATPSASQGNPPLVVPFLTADAQGTQVIQASAEAPSPMMAKYKPRGRFVR